MCLSSLPWANDASVISSQQAAKVRGLTWKECPENSRTLERVLRSLQEMLGSVRKHKLQWPTFNSELSTIPPGEYLTRLLEPIPNIYNQLRSESALKTPMECVAVELGDSSHALTFTAKDFKRWSVIPPVVVAIPFKLFEAKGALSSSAQAALASVDAYEERVTSIILTNYEEFAVIHPPSRICSDFTYEKISTDKPSLALQVLAAAYLYDAIRLTLLLNLPHPDIDLDETLILPEGPPQDPNAPLLPDEFVFATHHRHADFDTATLIRDKKRALQFFRWRNFVQSRYPKLVGQPGDSVVAKTNEVGIPYPSVRPLFPFDHSEVPSDTASHLKAVKRDCPLASSRLKESFNKSQSFTLKIISVIREADRGICTVYKCQITSIDGEEVNSPELCLKLFDDRIQPLDSPDPADETLDTELPRWFDTVVFAEMYALNEASAYDKLEPVQGSIIPWFYGTHQFTFPDGTVMCGLLMELIDGHDLDSEYAKNLSAQSQIKVIESARHAARVLDIADVSQRDWHHGQIIISKHPQTKEDHAVFLDFASTTQTWVSDERNYLSNYSGTLRVLLGRLGNVSLDGTLVWKHFGDPDDWDPVMAIIPVVPRGKEARVIQAKNKFSYITAA
ncbi:hypothetical protein ONZ45_g8894 [Pleurotus djamor]|nr:hypothetical protein ONZ45_g8894 [Pleurotus djamor]